MHKFIPERSPARSPEDARLKRHFFVSLAGLVALNFSPQVVDAAHYTYRQFESVVKDPTGGALTLEYQLNLNEPLPPPEPGSVRREPPHNSSPPNTPEPNTTPRSLNERLAETNRLLEEVQQNPGRVALSHLEGGICFSGNVVPEEKWRIELTFANNEQYIEEDMPFISFRPASYLKTDQGAFVCGYSQNFKKIHGSRALVVVPVERVLEDIGPLTACEDYFVTTGDEQEDFERSIAVSALACE